MTHIQINGLNFDLGLANFLAALNPYSALEFGCGIGLYTQYLVQAGVQGPVIGLEPNDMSSAGVFNQTKATYPRQVLGNVLENLQKQDLINAADVVYSIEVAEHIEEAMLPTLVSFLSSKVKRYLIFSAGRPGQGGTGHISLKPKMEWINLLERSGLKFLPNLTESMQASCDENNGNHIVNGFVMGKTISLDRRVTVHKIDRTDRVSKENHESIAFDIFPNVRHAIKVAAIENNFQNVYIDEGRFQKIIWMFWDKGWEKAPWIVQECAASWGRVNPTWNVTLVDQSTLGKFINLEEIPPMGPKMKLQGYTDVIRLLLLKTHGGVWADATVYCRLPLDEWLFSSMKSDFFAFYNPSNPHNVSSWFLASKKNGIVSEAWYAATLKEYRNPDYDGYYFFMHREYEKLMKYSTLMKVKWRHISPLSADGPHFLQRGNRRICEPYASLESKEIIVSKQVPMFKLSFKFACLNQTLSLISDSTLSYLKQSTEMVSRDISHGN
jgi:SAM-dependent methyltransferase